MTKGIIDPFILRHITDGHYDERLDAILRTVLKRKEAVAITVVGELKAGDEVYLVDCKPKYLRNYKFQVVEVLGEQVRVQAPHMPGKRYSRAIITAKASMVQPVNKALEVSDQD